MPWIKKTGKIPYQNANFKKILNFYLFNCPVALKTGKVSFRANTFEERNITGKYLTKLFNEMKSVMKNIYFADSTKNVEQIILGFKRSNLINYDAFEIVASVENTDIKRVRTIFYNIRNALAHGSFSINKYKGENYYSFECIKNRKLKAQIRLKESTLLNWIKLVDKYSL